MKLNREELVTNILSAVVILAILFFLAPYVILIMQ